MEAALPPPWILLTLRRDMLLQTQSIAKSRMAELRLTHPQHPGTLETRPALIYGRTGRVAAPTPYNLKRLSQDAQQASADIVRRSKRVQAQPAAASGTGTAGRTAG